MRGVIMDDDTKVGLISGDTVIVDRQYIDRRQGVIFAEWDGDGVVMMQVKLVRGENPLRIVCKSWNPTHAPIELTINGNTHVIGRITAEIARM